MIKKQHFESIFISDIHLATYGCKAKILSDFLKHHSSENLFLVGDIIDGWHLKKGVFFPESHVKIIKKFLKISETTNVVYIIGNHDEELRKWLKHFPQLGRIKITNEYHYIDIKGKKHLVVHGDQFDFLMTNSKWVMHLGDWLYDALIRVNDVYNKMRIKLGFDYWSLSQWLKSHTKEAVNFVTGYKEAMATYCMKHGYDGVICGHIHTAEIGQIEVKDSLNLRSPKMISYMNDGDWVESCTALVETMEGEWKIINWAKSPKEIEDPLI